jgi:dienelactone hydrolase
MKTIATCLVAALATIVLASPVLAQSGDVDLKAADGVNLKATYASPGRPGPGMLLIHQCNMDRTSWTGVTAALVKAGVHVLTLDLRGFGDSGGEGMSAGFPTFMEKSAGDADMAFDYLASQSGVDQSRMGVGGASCGGMINADLAARKDGVKVLMLLSSPPSEAAVKNMADTPGLAVFGAAAEDDPVTEGVADALRGAVGGSKHPDSTAKIYPGTEHGLPMFGKNPDLEPQLLDWLTEQLLGN